VVRFAVRRPAQPPASPRSHGMSGRDVSCRIDICVSRMTAGDATEDRLALAVFGCDVPAAMTGSRGISGSDLHDPTRGLLFKSLNQSPPTASEDEPVQRCFAAHADTRPLLGSTGRSGHALDTQVFYLDDVEAPGKRRRYLLNPVSSTVDLASDQTGDRILDAVPALRASLRPSESTLEPEESANFSSAGARSIAEISSRQCDRGHDSAINSYGSAVQGRRDRGRDGGKGDVPAFGSIECHSIGLCRWRFSAPSELDPAHLRDSYGPDLSAEATDVLSAHGNDAESLVPSRLAPARSPMAAGEVVGHRLTEISKSLLLDHLRASAKPVRSCSSIRQLTGLLKIRRRRAASRPPVVVLLDCQIPDVPSLPTMAAEVSRLRGRRHEAKSRHIMTFTHATDSFDAAAVGDCETVKAQCSNRIRGAR
jgi:hypothetical protein